MFSWIYFYLCQELRYLEKTHSSFSQTFSKVLSGSVHFLPPFLLILFVHSDGSQAFTYRACYTGHNASCTPYKDNVETKQACAVRIFGEYMLV